METSAQLLFCKYCEVFKNTYFEGDLLTVASVAFEIETSNLICTYAWFLNKSSTGLLLKIF